MHHYGRWILQGLSTSVGVGVVSDFPCRVGVEDKQTHTGGE